MGPPMAKGKGHKPLRTCISCRAKKEQDQLVRLTLDDRSRLVRDDIGRRPGRGAYTCMNASCRQKALKGNRLQRALRRPIQIDAEAVRVLVNTDLGE